MPTVGEALVDLLADYGVELVFGIPGTHSIELYRGLESGRIRHILPRNEQGGGFMADGYARAGNRPGVCFVITGPGVTNITTPLGEAYLDSVPLLVVSPVNDPAPGGKNLGRLHEINDQAAVTRPLTAFSETVKDPDEIPRLIARAFALFASGRPQPVHINIPLSILPMQIDVGWQAESLPARPIASDAQIEAALKVIQKAERPVLIVGGGTRFDADSMRALGEAIPAPILTTVAGRGVVPAGHPLSVDAQLRAFHVQDLLQEGDLAIFAATEFMPTDHWNENLRLPADQIWINLNPSVREPGDGLMLIQADAGDTARKLIESLPARSTERFEAAAARCERVRSIHARDMTDKDRRHWRILQEVITALPEDAVITSDMTQVAYTAAGYLPLDRPNSWFHPTGYGTLGYALPAAIGVALSGSAGPVLAIVGDAGLQYTQSEMSLAAELNLNLVVLLWDNQALQQIDDDMQAAGITPIGVRQRNPDFVALAKACGWQAKAVRAVDDLATDLREAFAAGQPVLLQLDQSRLFPPD